MRRRNAREELSHGSSDFPTTKVDERTNTGDRIVSHCILHSPAFGRLSCAVCYCFSAFEQVTGLFSVQYDSIVYVLIV